MVGSKRRADLCARLLREFEMEQTQCQAAVLAFLDELAADGRLEVEDAPAG